MGSRLHLASKCLRNRFEQNHNVQSESDDTVEEGRNERDREREGGREH